MSIGKTSVSTVCPSTLTYKHRQNLEKISKTKKVAQNMTEKPFGQKLGKKSHYLSKSTACDQQYNPQLRRPPIINFAEHQPLMFLVSQLTHSSLLRGRHILPSL